MFIQTKNLIIWVLVLLTVGAITGAVIYNNTVASEFYLDSNITVKLNDNSVTLKDSDDTVLKPIIYKRRAYLPIRSTSELLATDIKWNADDHLILISSDKK